MKSDPEYRAEMADGKSQFYGNQMALRYKVECDTGLEHLHGKA